MIVINALNARTAAQAEGESMGKSHNAAANIQMMPVFARDVSLASPVSRDRSWLRERHDVAIAKRANTVFATPQLARESSSRSTPPRPIELEDEEAAAEWDSLLDEIANDTASVRWPS